jgi:hypothetical protein
MKPLAVGFAALVLAISVGSTGSPSFAQTAKTPAARAPRSAAPAQSAPAAAKPASTKKTGADAASVIERTYGPLLYWHPDTKNPKTVLKADVKLLEPNASNGIFAEAVCAQNGASVNFKLVSDDAKPQLQFDWHPDPTKTDEGVVDVKVAVDGNFHIAKGFLTIDGDNQYVNDMGVLFYEPGLAAKTKGERHFEIRTGSSLDNLLGGRVAADAQDEIDEGIRTSAGPLRDLANARKILMEMPIRGHDSAIYDLNAQDPVFHAFAQRCYEHFATPAAPAPTSAPPRTPTTSSPRAVKR